MRFLSESLYVAGGAALGANARYWLGYWFVGRTHANFPWHTLLINVSGSLALGAFVALALVHGWSHNWRLFFAVGLCGGFTTFSAYSAEMVRLLEERQWTSAAGYILLSNVLCISACFAGAHLARILWPHSFS